MHMESPEPVSRVPVSELVRAPQRKYSAFISYKHQTSRFFAERIETALMSYAKPLLRRPRPVFRDERHLVPTADLPGLIRRALEDSEFLLLLASPEAAASPWVQSEIDIFCGELGRAANLVIILTAGEIAVEVKERTIVWDPTRTTALPPNLQRYLHAIPLYIDLRESTSLDALSLRHPTFKREINRLVAHFRNIDPDEMLGEELRVFRRNRLLAGGAIALFAFATVVLVFLTLGLRHSNQELARKRREAEERKEHAERLVRISATQLDAANARLRVEESPDEALAQLERAWKSRPPYDAAQLKLNGPADSPEYLAHLAEVDLEQALMACLSARPGLRGHLHGDGGSVDAMTISGNRLLSTAHAPYIAVWNLEQRRQEARLEHKAGKTLFHVQSSAAGRIAAASEDEVLLWESAGGAARSFAIAGAAVLAFDTRDQYLAIGTGSGALHVVELARGGSVRPLSARNGAISAIAFSPDGSRMYTGAYEQQNQIDVWDLASFTKLSLSFRGHSLAATRVRPSGNGALLVAATEHDQLAIWNARTQRLLRAWQSNDGTITDLAIDEQRRQIHAVHGNGYLATWSLDQKAEPSRRYAHRGGAYAVVARGDLLYTGGSDGRIREWTNEPSHPLHKHLTESKRFGFAVALDSNDGVVGIGSIGARRWNKGESVLATAHVKLDASGTLLGLSADGSMFITSGPFLGLTHDLTAWSTYSGAEITRIPNRARTLWAHAVSPSGKWFVAMQPGQPGTLMQWTLTAPVTEGPEPLGSDTWAQALAWDVDERRLAGAFSDGSLSIWNPVTRQVLARSSPTDGDKPTTLAFSHTLDLLAVGTMGGNLSLRSADEPSRVLALLQPHARPVHAITFDRLGRFMASGDADGTIIL